MLHGNKVKLRPIVCQDIDVLNKWKNDETVYAYLGGGYQPISIDQQQEWLRSMIDLTGNTRRFIILNYEEKPIGMTGLYDINWINKNCEIGIFVGEQDARGKGFATEACALIEDYAFNNLNLMKIKLKVVSENIAAYSLWKKLGYKEIGEYHKERYIAGEYYNVKLMEKIKE